MSDGITLNCPFCKGLATNLEYDHVDIKIKGNDYYSRTPIYTCKDCKKKTLIERMVKPIRRFANQQQGEGQ